MNSEQTIVTAVQGATCDKVVLYVEESFDNIHALYVGVSRVRYMRINSFAVEI